METLKVGDWIEIECELSNGPYSKGQKYAFQILDLDTSNPALKGLFPKGNIIEPSLGALLPNSNLIRYRQVAGWETDFTKSKKLTPEEVLHYPSEYEFGDWVDLNGPKQIVGKCTVGDHISYGVAVESTGIAECGDQWIINKNSFIQVNDFNYISWGWHSSIKGKINPPIDQFKVGGYFQCGEEVYKITDVVDLGFKKFDLVAKNIKTDYHHPFYSDSSQTNFSGFSLDKIILLPNFDPTKHSLFKNSKQKETKMTTEAKDKPSTLKMLKGDAEKAAYRVGARKISQATKNMIVNLLKKQKVKKGHISAVVELMDTEYGHAFVSFTLGMLLAKVPKIGDDPRYKKLCEEFRIEGMAIAGESLVDTLLDGLAPHLKDVIRSLPNEEPAIKMRIDATSQVKEEEHEEEEDKASKKKIAVLPNPTEKMA